MKNIFVVLVSMMLTIPSFAQLSIGADQGYIITNALDTVVGVIKQNTPAQQSVKLIFTDSETNEKHIYRPFEVKSWHIPNENIIYESKAHKIGRKNFGVFMRRLNEDGQIGCYEYWNTDGQNGFTQIFLERDGKMTEVNYGKFKKHMAEYFGDHEELKTRIENKEFKKKDLIQIVAIYNKWMEYKWGG
ncbi:MAG: hypothetical protein GY810_29610 [Aureispira sp.]|nr:hypothetical protein [Aureispira sp.]